ncbi:MAG: hypothetical protein CML16_04930 [Pusillimonas sp.]|nr:hypothetical protein [Pusillimonas sp.]|tara:strand:- start:7589 stop:7948 length:360 start_codon:yes stop_codon:yes gene_type:complete
MKNLFLIFLLLIGLSVGAQNYNFSKKTEVTEDLRLREYIVDVTLIIKIPTLTIYFDGSIYKYKIVSDPETCSTLTEKDVLICYEIIDSISKQKYLLKLRKDGTKFLMSSADGYNVIFSN